MQDFYADYYRALRTSRAHAQFCERAYGEDLGQHGFMTMTQLDALLALARLDTECRVLDVGCGNGRIAATIANATGAHVTGVDIVPEAICAARALAWSKGVRLSFVLGDLMRLGFRPRSFDVLLSIDTLYFSRDYVDTLCRWRELLAPRGRMLIFYSYGVDPEHPLQSFQVETLPPDKTPLGEALRSLGCRFTVLDFTADDCVLADRKVTALESLHGEFVSEGNQFLFENRLGEARGVKCAADLGRHVRYLYDVRDAQA